MITKIQYNTQRKRLPMPEYGRSIQNLVDYIVTIEDRPTRQRYAEAVIQLMGNMFPQWRDVQDFKHKLWDHLAFMSNYQLDIDYPVEIVRVETANQKPDRIAYKKSPVRFRHYGLTLEKFIESLKDYPEGPEKDQLVHLVALQMKRSLLQWNPTVASDKKLASDLAEMTGGAVVLTEEEVANQTANLRVDPSVSTSSRNSKSNKQKARSKKK